MQWEKLGRTFCPDGSMPWAKHSALTPTPVSLTEGLVRVYAGFRDDAGVSRIGWVDLRADDPRRVERVCRRPALDIGEPGCFDDNGVILGDVVHDDGDLLMFYVGFQLVARVKFLAFTGLARSEDGGDTFQRVQQSPILDRSPDGLCFRAVHTAMREGDTWRAWCGVGSGWATIGGTPYPSYTSACYEGTSPTSFASTRRGALEHVGDEYRIGRPRVYRAPFGYRMFYTVGTLRGTYLPGYAESADGSRWVRKDADVGIAPSEGGWDSSSLSYTALFEASEKTYMVYNGNEMGRDGFGLARLAAW
jgi:hypothetical protein